MTDDPDLALALLRWQLEMGADEAVGDAPRRDGPLRRGPSAVDWPAIELGRARASVAIR